MRRSPFAVLIAVCACALMVLPAVAQAPLASDYGGGAITEHDPWGHGARHDVVLGAGVAADGRVALAIRINARCASSSAHASTSLHPDGTFAVRGRESERFPHHFVVSSRYTVHGTITPEGGRGTATAFVTKRHGRRVQHCATRNVHWQVRPGHQPVQPPAPAPAGATLYGTSDQTRAGANAPVTMRVSSDGHRLTAGLFGFVETCRHVRAVDAFPSIIDIVKPATIAADGSFRSVERNRFRLSHVIDHEVIVFAGRFTANGAAGTLSFTDRYSSRADGKLVDVCGTGNVPWTALR